MFITREVYKAPLAALFLASGEAAWSATELALQQIWFLVQLEEFEEVDDSESSSSRTVLLFDFQSVEQFIMSSKDGKVRINSVHLVTPGHVNGTDSWKMDKLHAVWQGCESIDGCEIPMDIFETVKGEKYTAWFTELPTNDLASNTLKFKF